ncbi:MAG TPA: hypothetical protein VFY16_05425 [Gemmatimonadaceae bacterium]|jgi:hypothetical protein|nr:hypothetical protein [Gemmatimonadaceae bacterium]
MPKVNDGTSRSAGRSGVAGDWRRNERLVRERWDEMRAAMRDARQAGTEAWPEIRTDLERALGELRHALDLATERFRDIRARSAAAGAAAGAASSARPSDAPARPASPTATEAEIPPDLQIPTSGRDVDGDPEC